MDRPLSKANWRKLEATYEYRQKQEAIVQEFKEDYSRRKAAREEKEAQSLETSGSANAVEEVSASARADLERGRKGNSWRLASALSLEAVQPSSRRN